MKGFWLITNIWKAKPHLENVVSHNALGLDEHLVNHGVAVVTLHLMSAVLVVLNQRQQQLQRQSLSSLAVAQLHRLQEPADRDSVLLLL